MDEIKSIIKFEESVIRRVWHNEEWYFSIVDVIEVLTKSPSPRKYWSKVKKKLKSEGAFQTSPFWRQLKMLASDGKMRATDCASTAGILRIIQAVSSPKAEPFKQWLAQVGYERIQETENPELIIERIREGYKLKGYSDEWVETRLKSIGVRKQLTDEWQKRKVKKGREYAILTAELSQATFGLKPSEHKKMKGLKRENLRDHMTDLELIFTMLGETATRNETIKQNAIGFEENKEAVIKGGRAAGKALEIFEQEMDQKVVSDKNFKHQISESKKKKQLGKKKDGEH